MITVSMKYTVHVGATKLTKIRYNRCCRRIIGRRSLSTWTTVVQLSQQLILDVLQI